MSDLESILRRVIREEVRATFEAMLPQFRFQQSTEPTEPEDSLLLSTREAAKRLSISERTLYSLTKAGQLPCVRLGMAKRYSVETIKQWIQKAESEAVPLTRNIAPGPTNQQTKEPRKAARTRSKTTPRKKPKSHSNASSRTIPKSTLQQKRDEEVQRPNPMALLLNEIGLDYAVASEMSRGELMRIAGVDIPTYHGWRFLGRSMPEEAIEKLREHFRQLRKPE